MTKKRLVLRRKLQAPAPPPPKAVRFIPTRHATGGLVEDAPDAAYRARVDATEPPPMEDFHAMLQAERDAMEAARNRPWFPTWVKKVWWEAIFPCVVCPVLIVGGIILHKDALLSDVLPWIVAGIATLWYIFRRFRK